MQVKLFLLKIMFSDVVVLKLQITLNKELSTEKANIDVSFKLPFTPAINVVDVT